MRPSRDCVPLTTALSGPWTSYRGVASKIDALFAVNGFVTGRDLSNFFELATYVLSETDPALELPVDQQWMAGVYGKIRNHSAALRQGVCETLVILAVHGNNLFRARLGVDVELHISTLIHDLLTPLTLEKLLSQDDDLPRYAEAAPDTVLTILEADLRQPEPVVLGLLKPAESGLFGRCLRTGLLWAARGPRLEAGQPLTRERRACPAFANGYQ